VTANNTAVHCDTNNTAVTNFTEISPLTLLAGSTPDYNPRNDQRLSKNHME